MATNDSEHRAIDIVLDYQRQFWEALKYKDADQLTLLLAEDFICRSPGEPEQDRNAFIHTIINMPVLIEQITATHIAIDYFGAVAVLTGIQIATLRLPNGSQATEQLALTNLFRRTSGQWQMVLAHPVALPFRNRF